MINKKENKPDLLSKAIMIVLFFLFISAFSDNSVGYHHRTFQMNYILEMPSNEAHAILSEIEGIPVFKTPYVTSSDNNNINFFNQDLKISSDNHLYFQKFIFIEKTNHLINYSDFCKFYYHLFSDTYSESALMA